MTRRGRREEGGGRREEKMERVDDVSEEGIVKKKWLGMTQDNSDWDRLCMSVWQTEKQVDTSPVLIGECSPTCQIYLPFDWWALASQLLNPSRQLSLKAQCSDVPLEPIKNQVLLGANQKLRFFLCATGAASVSDLVSECFIRWITPLSINPLFYQKENTTEWNWITFNRTEMKLIGTGLSRCDNTGHTHIPAEHRPWEWQPR